MDLVTFNRAQAIVEKGKNGRSPYTPENSPFVLSGKLVCGRCGGSMWGDMRKGQPYYLCNSHYYDNGCTGTTVREDAILEALSEKIEQEFLPQGEWCRAAHELRQSRGASKPTVG